MTASSRTRRPRVGWFCSYTPEELLYAAGLQPERVLPDPGGADTAASWLAPNLCPYARQAAWMVEQGRLQHLDALVVADSCHAMLQLGSALDQGGSMPVYFLDVPRRQDQHAQAFFARQLEELAQRLGGLGSPVGRDELLEAIEAYQNRQSWLQEVSGGQLRGYSDADPVWLLDLASACSHSVPGELDAALQSPPAAPSKDAPRLLLTGSMPFRELVEAVVSAEPVRLVQDHCLGRRYLDRPAPGVSLQEWRDKPFLQLARTYLGKSPCPRMHPEEPRQDSLRNLYQEVPFRGVIFHDLGFCDLSHYDYLLVEDLCQQWQVPLLRVKTEMRPGEVGQIQTRVEAFLEMAV